MNTNNKGHPMLTQTIKEKIKNNLSHSLFYENIINEDDLKNLTKKVFGGWSESRTYSGGKIIFDSFDYQTQNYIKDFLQSYFPEFVPGSKSIPWEKITTYGNIYITPTEYGLHTDAFSSNVISKNEVTLKNIIIPLYVCGLETENPDINNLILMKNRIVDYSKNFQKNLKSWTVKYQDTVTDYKNLNWTDENGNDLHVQHDQMYITDEDYQRHLSHITNKEILESFQIEKIAKFNTGNIIIHDTTQVHVTSNMKKKDCFVSNKAGLRLSLRISLDDLK